MEDKDFVNALAHTDISEVLIRANKAREFINKGQTEDAIAYAMSAGFRLGWEAHKKKVGES